jgi:hypothetical protein
MLTIIKATILLLFFLVQYVAADDFLYCEWVIVNSTKTKRRCSAVPSTPACNVTCTSSTCNRGFEYEIDCSNSTNYKTECPVCLLNTATTCPGDCTVECDPLTATWDCEDPLYMVVQRPNMVKVCEEPVCVDSASGLAAYAVLIASLFV